MFVTLKYRFLTTETNSKALYIFRCLFTTSSVKLFVVNVQIFVYNCVFWKKEKQHSRNLSHFENESAFRNRNTFWKWKLILKPIKFEFITIVIWEQSPNSKAVCRGAAGTMAFYWLWFIECHNNNSDVQSSIMRAE